MEINLRVKDNENQKNRKNNRNEKNKKIKNQDMIE